MLNKVEVGSLVADADPYKAPEALYGIGIVIKVINHVYVEVQWVQWSFTSYEKKINLEVINEGWRFG